MVAHSRRFMHPISKNAQGAAAPPVLRPKATLASIPASLIALALAILLPIAALLLPLLFYSPLVYPFSAPLAQLAYTLRVEILPNLADPGALLAEALHLESASTTSASSGAVRVNNLAMLEALFDVSAGGTELVMIAVGSFVILATLFHSHNGRHRAATIVNMSQTNILRDPITMHCLDKGTRLICAGIMVPVVLKWLFSLARDAVWFN